MEGRNKRRGFRDRRPRNQNKKKKHNRRNERPASRVCNRLWMQRKKCRLGQKQLAYLMGIKSVTLISRYESGEKLPNLVNAIKLELILGSAIRFLFPELWSQLHREILGRQNKQALPLS